MTARTRPYAGDDDLRRMLELVGQAAAQIGPAKNMHLGDVLWRRFMLDEAIVEPQHNVRLWEETGELVGFAWFSPPGSLETQVKPGHDAELLDAMLDWAETRAAEVRSDGTADRALDTDAFTDDAERIARLESRGFRRDDGAFYLLNARPLAGQIPPALLPPGATIRPVGDDEIAPRVAIHREVWYPSRVTESAYRRLWAAPGYRPDLDLVAVAPDGELASYCICWFDPISRTGEFEPVGTRAAYRGQGYGRAVVTEGLRRLRALGAETAIVFSNGTAVPANCLYAACGFQPIARTYLYRADSQAPGRSVVSDRP